MTPTSEDLNAAMLDLHRGIIVADHFLRVASRKLSFLARDIWYGWRKKLPSWVECVDIEQELQIRVLEFVPKWDPSQSEKIWDFVIWSATHRTQRQIHKWRGASIHGNEGANPSRAELAISSVIKNEVGNGSKIDSFLSRLSVSEEEEVENKISRQQMLEIFLGIASSKREAIVARALIASGGKIHEAVVTISNNFDWCVHCRVPYLERNRVRSAVRSALIAMAKRYEREMAEALKRQRMAMQFLEWAA